MIKVDSILLGYESDLHLDRIVMELAARGSPFLRLDPQITTYSNIRVHQESSNLIVEIANENDVFCFSSETSVLCRYALETFLYADHDGEDPFSKSEFFSHFVNAFCLIPQEKWINHPFIESFADLKFRQLRTAQACGLSIPPSIITQDIEKLRLFTSKYGRCVIKALGDHPLRVEKDGVLHAGFTAELDEDAVNSSRWDHNSSVFVQALIPKIADIRTTVIDDCCFAAKITVPKNSPLDFRNSEKSDVVPYDLNDETRTNLIKLVKALGLRYASCDLGLCQDGSLWFFEANVSGNYLWTEHAAGLPISVNIANALTAGK